MATVLISRDLPEIGKRLLIEAGLQVTAWPHERPMTADELTAAAQKHDALLCLVSDKIDKPFLEANKHLEIISQFGAGFDNIDVETATQLGIPVGNTPGATSEATADIAFSLMLAVSRKLFWHHRTIARKEWGFFRPKANLGFQLTGKTLGIFGLGRIGMELAKRCKGAYDMPILYHNRRRNAEAEEKFNARWVSFDELLAQSDIVSANCVLSAETRGIFDKKAFARMKPSAIFINASRGLIHQEEDLLEALQSGVIWGAGLDVTNPEPMRHDHPFLEMENVAVLPHIGSATVETRDEMARLAATNIVSFYKDGSIPYLVNPDYSSFSTRAGSRLAARKDR